MPGDSILVSGFQPDGVELRLASVFDPMSLGWLTCEPDQTSVHQYCGWLGHMILMGSFYLQQELTAFQDNSFLLVHPPPFLMKGLQCAVVIVF